MEKYGGACLPWMDSEDFKALRAISNNPANLPLLYEDWLRGLENTKKKLKRQGEVFIVTEVNGPMFILWCLNNRRDINHKAWIDFLSAKGRESQIGG
jgi:hypothetical protein